MQALLGARLAPASLCVAQQQPVPPRAPLRTRRQQAAQRVGTTGAFSTRSPLRDGAPGGATGQYSGRSSQQEALEWRTRETPKEVDAHFALFVSY